MQLSGTLVYCKEIGKAMVQSEFSVDGTGTNIGYFPQLVPEAVGNCMELKIWPVIKYLKIRRVSIYL